jgi:ribosomal protein S18 acetylase RimI-like enzyme
MTGEPGYLIREATVADAPALARVIRAAFEEYRGRLDPPSGAHGETAAMLEALLDREYAFFAAAPDGMLLGCVFCDAKRDEFYLHRLAVLPEARGCGVGAALVAAVEKSARDAGRTWVTLGVRIALPENRRYYERLGYCVVAEGTHKGYSSLTFWRMSKQVAPSVTP